MSTINEPGLKKATIIGHIAEEVRRVEDELRESRMLEEGPGVGVAIVVPDDDQAGDLVIRFSDGVVLSVVAPAIANLVASLVPGEVVECDFPDGHIYFGFTKEAWDTPEKFQTILETIVEIPVQKKAELPIQVPPQRGVWGTTVQALKYGAVALVAAAVGAALGAKTGETNE